MLKKAIAHGSGALVIRREAGMIAALRQDHDHAAAIRYPRLP
jgi:hypothetical protein